MRHAFRSAVLLTTVLAIAAVGCGVGGVLRPAVQGLGVFPVDVVPGPPFPGTKVHFLEAGIQPGLRADGPGQFEAAAQGAGMEGGLRRQQGPQALGISDGRSRQGQVGTAVANAVGHQGPGMADQVEVHRLPSSPR